MKKLLIFGLFLAVALSFVPMFSHAQEGLVPCGIGDPQGPDYVSCGICHLFQLVNAILNWVLFVLIPIIAPIFIVIGGIYLLVARGDPGMFNRGKSILTATVIGLIIVYVAWVVLMTILNFLGVAPWTGLGTWWQIDCPVP